MSKQIIGLVNSIQSLGTVDGPGIRYVIFMQGCPLRCGCCHNPDTWDVKGGTKYFANDIVDKALRYTNYFGKDGGVTISGGEPLMQPEFVQEVFELCHKNGINTCLDTSGCILNDNVKELLKHTDRVLLDINYTDNALYKKHVGCSLDKVLHFLTFLNEQNVPTTIRQVIIPTLNDSKQNVLELKKIISPYSAVDGVELLAFKNICKVKYDALNLKFKLSHLSSLSLDKIKELNEIIQ